MIISGFGDQSVVGVLANGPWLCWQPGAETTKTTRTRKKEYKSGEVEDATSDRVGRGTAGKQRLPCSGAERPAAAEG
jgi:hypothetical protein